MVRASWPLFIVVFLASFLALRWPNIWPKMMFLQLFEKTIGSILVIPGFILMGRVSWPLYIFVFLASFFGPLVAKHLAENGVSATFWKKLLAQFIIFLKNSHLSSTRLPNRNLNWIFLDEVVSDQSGGMMSPFMGTACFSRSSVKLQGHTGWKINDFNPIWVRLLGRSYQIPQICLVNITITSPRDQWVNGFTASESMVSLSVCR